VRQGWRRYPAAGGVIRMDAWECVHEMAVSLNTGNRYLQ